MGLLIKKKDSQACLSISQLLFFNSKKKDNQATYVSHSKEREPPLPIYLGLMVHSQTRSKKLVQTFFELGFSISYSRVTQLEQKLASSLCEQYAKDQAVIPASLKDSSFTVCAVDNIDHNLSSTTATISFHGTSISYHQHITESSKDRPKFILSDQNYDIKLPESYSVVPCLDEIVTKAEPPKLTVFHPHFDGSEEIKKEDDWLKDSQRMLAIPFIENLKMSWAAHHADNFKGEVTPCLTGLVPIFDEKAASASMMRHAMSTVKSTIEKLNPGQIPVICGDQPLFALMKRVQWKFPEEFGEEKMAVVMG